MATMTPPKVEGTIAEGYEPVREAFVEKFTGLESWLSPALLPPLDDATFALGLSKIVWLGVVPITTTSAKEQV